VRQVTGERAGQDIDHVGQPVLARRVATGRGGLLGKRRVYRREQRADTPDPPDDLLDGRWPCVVTASARKRKHEQEGEHGGP